MKYNTGTVTRDSSSDATSPAINEIGRPWKITDPAEPCLANTTLTVYEAT